MQRKKKKRKEILKFFLILSLSLRKFEVREILYVLQLFTGEMFVMRHGERVSRRETHSQCERSDSPVLMYLWLF